MAEPFSTSATAALVKLIGFPVLAGSLAAALGFMFLWPHSRREAFARFASSILSSAILGPLLVVWAKSLAPNLFEASKDVAVMYGSEPAIGFLFVAAPIMVAAGLPAWWVIGGIFRWLDSHKESDIVEMTTDVVKTIRRVRKTTHKE